MKNLALIAFVICTLIITTISNVNAQYQTASYNYSSSSSFDTEFAVLVDEIEKTGYTLVDYDITSLGMYQQFPWDLTCYSGREYVVFGYTEAGVKDLGLYIYDNNGKYVTANPPAKNKGITFVKFNAYSTTKARIIAKNENSTSSYKKYKLGIVVAYRYK